MEFYIEEILDETNLTKIEKINFSNREVDDVLIESIKSVEANVTALAVGDDEFHFTLNYNVDVKYLDARDLKPLDLSFTFDDDVIFTSDMNKAEELELEEVNGDTIHLDELLFSLACANIPINHSVADSNLFTKESEDVNSNNPFVDVFKK